MENKSAFSSDEQAWLMETGTAFLMLANMKIILRDLEMEILVLEQQLTIRRQPVSVLNMGRLMSIVRCGQVLIGADEE